MDNEKMLVSGQQEPHLTNADNRSLHPYVPDLENRMAYLFYASMKSEKHYRHFSSARLLNSKEKNVLPTSLDFYRV